MTLPSISRLFLPLAARTPVYLGKRDLLVTLTSGSASGTCRRLRTRRGLLFLRFNPRDRRWVRAGARSAWGLLRSPSPGETRGRAPRPPRPGAMRDRFETVPADTQECDQGGRAGGATRPRARARNPAQGRRAWTGVPASRRRCCAGVGGGGRRLGSPRGEQGRGRARGGEAPRAGGREGQVRRSGRRGRGRSRRRGA